MARILRPSLVFVDIRSGKDRFGATSHIPILPTPISPTKNQIVPFCLLN